MTLLAKTKKDPDATIYKEDYGDSLFARIGYTRNFGTGIRIQYTDCNFAKYKNKQIWRRNYRRGRSQANYI